MPLCVKVRALSGVQTSKQKGNSPKTTAGNFKSTHPLSHLFSQDAIPKYLIFIFHDLCAYYYLDISSLLLIIY